MAAEPVELEPFPLAGVCASHLEDMLDELSSTFIKISVRLIGKNEIAPRALVRLGEKLGPALGGGKGIKSVVEVESFQATNDGTESVVINAIILARHLAPRLSNISVASLASSTPSSPTGANSDPATKIRENLKTTVQRQNAAKRLGEEADIVPFLGFTAIEIGTEEDLTTKEVCELYIKPKTAKSKGSYVEMVAEEEHDLVAAAGTIVIHSWSSPFKSIWDSLKPELKARGDDPSGVFIWLDVLSIPQHSVFTVAPRWLTTTLCDAIGTIGSSVLVLADWKNPEPFGRLWCIWELLATIQQGTELSVIMPPDQRKSFDERVFHDLPAVIKASFDAIDSEHAVCTIKNDETQILSSIRDSIGFDGANLVVKDRLLEWLSTVSEVTAKDPDKTRDHLATATFCFRLAKIMSGAQGKHAEAEQLLRRAVEIRTVELGSSHDLTIECQIALANVFRIQGKLAEADVTLRKVCESLTASKGPEDEMTLLARATLSRVLVDRGSFDEAEQICTDSLAITQTKFGLKDKRTLETLVTLSQLADLRCDSDTAALRLRKALEGFEQLFGPDAPQTLNIKADLAGFLAELENFDEAEALFKEASEKLAVALGPSHEWTIKATTGLSVLSKVKEGLGPNYTPGRFANKAALPNVPPTISENSEVTNADSSVVTPEPISPPSPKKKISFDPNLDNKPDNGSKDADTPVMGQQVPEELNSLRNTRHTKIKSNNPGKAKEDKAGASRKHLRGWLEKLPIELSQREKERLARKESLGGLKVHGSRASLLGAKQKPGGKSMLLKMASGLGSSIGFGRPQQKRSSVPNMGTSVSSLNTDVVKMNRVNGNWEKRFFQAQSNQKSSSLVYWLNDDDCRNGREKRGDFPLDDFNSRIFETSPFGPTAFSITGPKGRLHLRAATVEQKHEWIEVFKVALAFRGAADKAKLLEPNGEVPASYDETRAFFTGSFVNMDSLLGQHSVVLGEGEDLLKQSMMDMDYE